MKFVPRSFWFHLVGSVIRRVAPMCARFVGFVEEKSVVTKVLDDEHPTAGANGDITFMVLPGNLQVSFTGHNVRHADGRQLKRVGIEPTIRVAPTIRGWIEGRDEILERAVKYLGESSKK